VVVRLAPSKPILTRFHFVLSGGVTHPTSDVLMATRGDTLVVAANLSAETAHTLTYLEMDSRSLP
jgi:hypothetical protein